MAQRCTRAWRQLEVKNGNKSTTTSGHDYAGKRGDHCYFVQFFDGLSKLRASTCMLHARRVFFI